MVVSVWEVGVFGDNLPENRYFVNTEFQEKQNRRPNKGATALMDAAQHLKFFKS
jgi:hypothetical protein